MRENSEFIVVGVIVLLILGIIFGLGKWTIDKHKVETRWTWKAICKDMDKRAKFIIDCAKAANPMSDEEGEDLVKQCEKTSESLFCEFVKEYY